jgi:hypothetical protein
VLQSSILHSAITAHHRGGSTSSPTIASLLHSSPGIPAAVLSSVAPPPVTVSSSLKNLVTSAIGAAGSEDTPKPPSTSPAAGELSDRLYTLCHREETVTLPCSSPYIPCHVRVHENGFGFVLERVQLCLDVDVLFMCC